MIYLFGIIGMMGAGYLGYLIGYELGWYDRCTNKKHRLRNTNNQKDTNEVSNSG